MIKNKVEKVLHTLIGISQTIYTKNFARPLIRLLRLHTLTGWFLLTIPCLWGHVCTQQRNSIYPLMMMAVAALWARSLGCLYNDWVDRKIDLCVDRTRSRPLACGDLSGKDLIYLATLWGVMGIPFLWLFPLPVLFLGVVGLGGSIIYPFLKRVWGYPQFFLGFLFNLGVFGPSLWYGGFSTIWGPWVALYIQGILWTVEYDSIYACQDYEDDKRMTMFSFPVTIGKKNVKSYILLSIIARYLILSIVCKKNQGIFGAVMILEFIEIILLDIECVRSCGDYFKRCPLKGLAITAALL